MATRKTTKAQEVDAEVEPNVAENDTRPIIPKDIDLGQLITVKNGFNGKLIYISSRTKEKFVWDNFGDEQELELRELRNAKSSAKKFFMNNYFMFDEEFEWVVSYLGLGQYYKNAIRPDEYDDLFDLPADKLKARLEKLSDGQKKSIGYLARQKMLDGEIDSRKAITTLEEVLGTQLVEH